MKISITIKFEEKEELKLELEPSPNLGEVTLKILDYINSKGSVSFKELKQLFFTDLPRRKSIVAELNDVLNFLVATKRISEVNVKESNIYYKL